MTLAFLKVISQFMAAVDVIFMCAGLKLDMMLSFVHIWQVFVTFDNLEFVFVEIMPVDSIFLRLWIRLLLSLCYNHV